MYIFYKGANWFLCSVPFFTLREVIIHLHHNRASTYTTFKDRSRVDLLASAWSGGVVGGGIGWIWRGKWAVVPVALVHALGAGLGQSIVTIFDTWRIKQAISRLVLLDQTHSLHGQVDDASATAAKTPFHSKSQSVWAYNLDTSLKPKLNSNNQEYPQTRNWRTQYFEADPNDTSLIDPIKTLFDNIGSFIGWWGVSSTSSEKTSTRSSTGDKDWEWVRYATDVEYRKKLSYKVVLLKEQITQLRKELRERGIEYQDNSSAERSK